MQMQFKLVYENAQDDTIRGSIENIPTDNDEILCYRSDIEGKGLVYETRDEKDGLVIMASEDHLPGGEDDLQVYPAVTDEVPDPDPDPKPGDGEDGEGVIDETPGVEGTIESPTEDTEEE